MVARVKRRRAESRADVSRHRQQDGARITRPAREPGRLRTEGAMRRLHRAVTAVGAAVVMVVASGPRGFAQTNVRPEGQTVHLLRGSITGTVVDERGGPLAGVVVSALGATMAMTISDGRGALRPRLSPHRRIHRPGAPERIRRIAARARPGRAPPRRPSGGSCCASSTSRSGPTERRRRCPPGRSWRPDSTCPVRPSSDQPDSTAAGRTPTIIRTPKPRGACATSSAAS